LEDARGQRVTLDVAVPFWAWNDRVWRFELRARLHTGGDDERCSQADPERVWLRVDGDAALIVPREERVDATIANFYRGAHQQRPWLSGYAPKKSTQWWALAKILRPFDRVRPHATWQWHDGTAGGPVIELGRPDASAEEGAVSFEARRYWHVGAWVMPLLPVNASASMQLVEKKRLRVWLAPGLTPAPPRYHALDGAAAWFRERWHVLEAVVAPESPEHRVFVAPANVAAEEEQDPVLEPVTAPSSPWWWHPDVWWLLGSLVVVGGLVYGMRRMGQMARDDSKHREVHGRG